MDDDPGRLVKRAQRKKPQRGNHRSQKTSVQRKLIKLINDPQCLSKPALSGEEGAEEKVKEVAKAIIICRLPDLRHFVISHDYCSIAICNISTPTILNMIFLTIIDHKYSS